MDKKIDFEEIVQHLPFVVMRLSYEDGMWKIWYVTKNVARYGFSTEELLSGQSSWNGMLHPDDRVLAFRLASDYIRQELDDFRLDYRILTKAGESINITEFSHIVRNPDGSVFCVDSVLLNTTDVQIERDIAANHFRQQAVLTDILLSLQDADYETSLQIILNRAGAYINTSRALLFKDSPDHKTCKVVYEWLNEHITSVMDLDYAVTYSTEMPEIYVALQKTGMLLVDAGEIPENCREEFEKEGLVSSAIFAVYLHGEHYGFVCFDDCVIERKWNNDDVVFLKNIANLISNVLYRMHMDERLKRTEEETRQLAFTDFLTGLPNRFRCNRDLADAIRRLRVNDRFSYALFIDLDDFKIVNDCYGHEFGDGVLKSFAKFIAQLFQGDNKVYRFGGDEFVILVADGDEKALDAYLQALLERAKKPWASFNREFYCSLSIGVVRFSGTGDTAESVIKKADIAMYQAKKSGKNNFAVYTEGLDSDSVKRTEVEAMLRVAMENGCEGFDIHYQPYSDAKTQAIVGAEALLRMRAPDGTLLLPEKFLSLAEYLGLIVPLGEFVMARAAEQCREINSLPGLEDFTVTINVSPRQLKQKNIVHRTEEILRKSGVNFANIILSINESTALGETERMLQAAQELRKLGLRVALNEFGSASSSFINMRALPVDVVKISSTYLEDVDDEFTGAFVKLVTDLGHFSNKVICMNDVETDGQYEFCRKFGIDIVQGFLFHRPNDISVLHQALARKMTRVFYR